MTSTLRALPVLFLSATLLLGGCGGRGTTTSIPRADQLETVRSVSPALYPVPPMASTPVLPASEMVRRTPRSVIKPAAWTQITGGAVSVAAAQDGSVWVLSNAGSGPNRSIWHYVSGTWTNIVGSATRIAVAPDSSLWVVNSAGGIYHLVNGAWYPIAGGGSDITVDSGNNIIVVSIAPGGQYGHGLWKWDGGNWTQIPGAGERISATWDMGTYAASNVAPGGFFVTNNVHNIFYYHPGSGFTVVPGGATQTAPTVNGGLFVLGSVPNPNGSSPIFYNDLATNTWTQQPGAALSISVSGSNNYVYVVGADNGIYKSALVPGP